MAIHITFVGDTEDEVLEQIQTWLQSRTPEAEAEEAGEETGEETGEEGSELLGGEDQPEEEVDPMQELRDKIVARIRAMSTKPAEIAKIKAAFAKLKIAKFDENVKDPKLAPLAKLLGVKA